MAAKNVLLVRGGSYGMVDQTTYDIQIREASEGLVERGATFEIVALNNLEARLKQRPADAVVFFTKGLMRNAAEIARLYNIATFVFTAAPDVYDRHVVVIDKVRGIAEQLHLILGE